MCVCVCVYVCVYSDSNQISRYFIGNWEILQNVLFFER